MVHHRYKLRKATAFKKGHRYYKTDLNAIRNKYQVDKREVHYKRLNISDYERTTERQEDSAEKPPTDVRLLRPAKGHLTSLEKAQVGFVESEMDTYRLFHLKSLDQMYSESYREHYRRSPKCGGDLHIDIENEKSWGLGWKEQLKCSTCAYKSKMYKLYKSIETGKPGPNPADLNYLVHVGLSHGATSSSGLCKVFLSMNMPSPFPQSMQRSANQVGQLLIKENQANMKQIRELLKNINVWRGHKPDAPISIAMDGTYNNRLGSKKGTSPMQPATQTVHITNEEVTQKKYIINVVVKNKLCKTGRLHNAKTPEKVICPNHPGKCTANISLETVIGEYAFCCHAKHSSH